MSGARLSLAIAVLLLPMVAVLLLLHARDIHGNDIPMPSKNDQLLRAAGHGDVEALEKLLRQGADPNAKFTHDFVSWTALQVAAREGYEEAVRMLLQAGAHSDEYDLGGETALHQAARRGHVGTVRALIAAGASVNAAKAAGQPTPLYTAARTASLEVVQALLEAHADPNIIVGHDGGTALHAAARENSPDVVAALVHGGASVEYKDNYKFTALLAAASMGRAEVVKRLLGLGANVDAQDHLSGTSLFRACQGGHTAAVKVLLASGANMYLADVGGRLPVDVATNDDIKQLLAQAAADQRGLLELTQFLRGLDMTDVFSLLRRGGVSDLTDLHALGQQRLESLGLTPPQSARVYAKLHPREAHTDL